MRLRPLLKSKTMFIQLADSLSALQLIQFSLYVVRSYLKMASSHFAKTFPLTVFAANGLYLIKDEINTTLEIISVLRQLRFKWSFIYHTDRESRLSFKVIFYVLCSKSFNPLLFHFKSLPRLLLNNLLREHGKESKSGVCNGQRNWFRANDIYLFPE